MCSYPFKRFTFTCDLMVTPTFMITFLTNQSGCTLPQSSLPHTSHIPSGYWMCSQNLHFLMMQTHELSTSGRYLNILSYVNDLNDLFLLLSLFLLLLLLFFLFFLKPSYVELVNAVINLLLRVSLFAYLRHKHRNQTCLILF